MAKLTSYETMVILKPTLSKEETDKIIDRFQDLIKAQGGQVSKVDRMGKRRIAYEMKKNIEGFYGLYEFQAGPDVVAELERQLRLTDEVLKFQSLKQDPLALLPAKKPAPAPAAA